MLASNDPGFAPAPNPNQTPAAQPVSYNAENTDAALTGAGLNALGATPQDIAALHALKATGRDVDLPTLLANKKRTVVPGTPAINAQTEASQIPWRTGMQKVTEGAKPIDEERWKNVQDLSRQAVDAQAQAQLAEGQAARDVANAQAVAAQQLHQRMADEQARQEQTWQTQHQQLLGEVDAASKSAPDTQRWFAQHGATGTMFAILGSMFQGYGAGLHGQFGPSMLERFVDKDIQQQNLDIERKGMAARNKLMDLSQQYGSLEAGRAALRASQLRLADSQMQQLAANSRSPAIQSQVEATRKAMEAKIAQADYDLRAAAMGTQKVAETDQFMLPRKGTAGGVRTTYNLGGVIEQSNKEREMQAKEGEKEQEGAEKIAEKAEFVDPSLKAVDEYAQAAGFVRGSNGKWEAPKGHDHPLFGPWNSSLGKVRYVSPLASFGDTGPTEARLLAAQKLEEAAAAGRRAKYTRAAGGGGGAEEFGVIPTQDKEQELLLGKSPKQSAEALNGYIENLKVRGETIRAGQQGGAARKFEKGKEREENRDLQSGRSQARESSGFQRTGLKVH